MAKGVKKKGGCCESAVGCYGVVVCVKDPFLPLLSLRPLVVGEGVLLCTGVGTAVVS